MNLAKKLLSLYEMSDKTKTTLESVLNNIVDDYRDKFAIELIDVLIEDALKTIERIKKENVTNITAYNYRNRHDPIVVQSGLIQTSEIKYSPQNVNLDFIKLDDDHKANAKKLAEKYAKEMFEMFKKKVTTKLSEILLNSEDPEIKIINPNIRGRAFEVEILFKFKKSQFTIKTQIVNVWGNSKPFTRYPLTFSNVILPTGEKLKSPSESKIKKIEKWE